MPKTLIDLNTLANGALLEKANKEMQSIVDNVSDPNTNPTAKRELTIKIVFSPNEERDILQTEVSVKSKLSPQKGVSTKFLVGETSTGHTAGEMKSNIPGQFFIDTDGEVKDDHGTTVDELEKTEENEKIVKFK